MVRGQIGLIKWQRERQLRSLKLHSHEQKALSLPSNQTPIFRTFIPTQLQISITTIGWKLSHELPSEMGRDAIDISQFTIRLFERDTLCVSFPSLPLARLLACLLSEAQKGICMGWCQTTIESCLLPHCHWIHITTIQSLSLSRLLLLHWEEKNRKLANAKWAIEFIKCRFSCCSIAFHFLSPLLLSLVAFREEVLCSGSWIQWRWQIFTEKQAESAFRLDLCVFINKICLFRSLGLL
jgi:DNA-binding XRE family transcriptional regulator